MPTKQPLDYARHTREHRTKLNRKYAITPPVVKLLFIAVIMVGLKLIGDAVQANKEMKSCQQQHVAAGFTDHEAKGDCRR